MVNVAASLLAYPIYLRYLGLESYGIWIVLSTVLSFVQLTNLGIGPAVMTFVAAEHGSDSAAGIQRYVTTALFTVAATGLVAAATVTAFRRDVVSVFNLSGTAADQTAILIPLVALLSAYAFVVQVSSAVLTGLGRMDLSSAFESVGRIAGLAISTILLASGMRLPAMLIGSLVSCAVPHLLTSWALSRLTSARFLRPADLSFAALRDLLRVGWGMLASSFVSMLSHPLNRLILTRWSGVASLPAYEIAFSAALQLRSLLESGFRALSPEVSRLTNRSATALHQATTLLLRKATTLVTAVGGLTWLVLAVIASPLLHLWLGERFIPGLPNVFRILLLGTYCGLLGVPYFYVLMGLRRTGSILIHHLVQSVTSATTLLLTAYVCGHLMPWHAAFAATAGMITSNLYLILVGRRTLGVIERAALAGEIARAR